MDFFTAMGVSASGLSAQRVRMNVASSNLANAQTTRGADGGPYRRRDVVLSAGGTERAVTGRFAKAIRGVSVDAVVQDGAPPRKTYDPGHPDADEAGYVSYPNVNVVEEMVDMITASRAYEAGISALESAVALAERAISIGR